MVQQYTLATARTADYLYASMGATDTQMDLSATNNIMSSVCKHAMLKKVKTNKHKFFVLHKDSATAPARLEYYNTESQWIKRKKAKRTIYLRACFSINAFSDTKAKFGMTIFTKDDSFQIGFDCEEDRDMWLTDLRLLSHTSHESRSIVQHMWNVKAHTRNMKCPFDGEFKLCLNEHQATLVSKKSPDQVLELPLMVITNCVHKDKYCGLDLSSVADTGAGELWVELEDALIAQHVFRAFMQNLALISPGEDSFRPVSRSMSYMDRKTAGSVRLRSGSDARQIRNRIGQSLYKVGQFGNSVTSSNGRTNSTMGLMRERSDSVDSHSTTASLSTDESELSRAATPDTRMESPAYLPMNFSKRPTSSDFNCTSSNSSLTNTDYADMSLGHIRSHDRNSNFMYVDMTGSSLNSPYTEMSRKDSGYIDMTVGSTSPKYHGYKMKPEPVKCYLIEDEALDQTDSVSRPVSRSGSQASPNPVRDGDYVEMCKRKVLSGKDKSSSAPHLLPLIPYQQQDQLPELDSIRDRTSSMTCHRPRGSSWGQFIRPRASTTEQKHRISQAQRANAYANLKPLGTDYIDMNCGRPTTEPYMDMCANLRNRNSATHSNPTQHRQVDDKENQYHIGSPRSGKFQIVDPFPELSASSEDDISIHSMEGCLSLQSLTSNSLTSSADSMSTSSHSSHYGPGMLTSTLDSEAYVAMQPASTSYVQSCSQRNRLLFKPHQVTSYILDDNHEQKSSAQKPPSSDYMDMVPANLNKHTKQ